MCIAMIFATSLTNYEIENDLQSVEAPEWFVIEGLVENPINLTYTELRNFPLLSEVTVLECIGSGQGGISVTYNWRGVPLFYLLNIAKVIPGAYREVVFNATDGFSSSVLLETAMDPTTILAVEANGTDLEQIGGFGSGYRVVLPCRWGYKWVKWIKQIIVVDYDYKGTYEQVGFSDEAIRPNCTIPSTDPPLQTFNVAKLKEYAVKALSNSTIESFSFESDRRMIFNVTGPEETSGYFYVTFPKELLAIPYQVYVDQNPINYSQTEADDNIYLCFTYTHSTHTIEIITNSPAADFVYSPLRPVEDEPITFDASTSLPGWNGTHATLIINYTWNFGDGIPTITEANPVVTHNYTAVGTYTVTLNITDSKGLWDTASKTITTIFPHDMAIINITPAKTVVGQGYKCKINVTAENQGTFNESFNVTFSVNATRIENKTVDKLTPGTSKTLVFEWNTTMFDKGNYTISAYAEPVLGEIDTTDNTFTDGTVKVTIVGDISGDCVVDMTDLGWIAYSYGATPSDPKWNSNRDITDDDLIDMTDLGIAAMHYGETCP